MLLDVLDVLDVLDRAHLRDKKGGRFSIFITSTSSYLVSPDLPVAMAVMIDKRQLQRLAIT